MKAILTNYRQSPRKVRLVGDLVKGKSVADAITSLRFTPKRASAPITKLIESAVANAKSQGKNEANLKIDNLTVNKGTVLKRIMPRARGSASRINKRNSHLTVTLKEVEIVAKKSKIK